MNDIDIIVMSSLQTRKLRLESINTVTNKIWVKDAIASLLFVSVAPATTRGSQIQNSLCRMPKVWVRVSVQPHVKPA